jgi:hypothetical protein
MQSALRVVADKDKDHDKETLLATNATQIQTTQIQTIPPASLGEHIEDYVPVNKLGQGASGVVYLVRLKGDSSNALYVLKQVELAKSRAYRSATLSVCLYICVSVCLSGSC